MSSVTIAKPTVGQKAVAVSNVDSKQALKAFKALAVHTEKFKQEQASKDDAKNLLPLDGPQGDLKERNNAVFVLISVKKLHTEKRVKPVRIPVPHAVHRPGEVSVCLLVKDPQRTYKDLLVEQKVKFVTRVVGVEKLRGKFKPFEARRELVRDHDIFLADDRVVPLVPKLCGKVFFDAKKNPITVNITRVKTLKEELASAISSTSFIQNKGSCSSIKLGYLSSHTAEQLTDNIMAVLPAIISRIPDGWNNIQNIEVKTGSSASLPIWNCKLGVKGSGKLVSEQPLLAESEPKSIASPAKLTKESKKIQVEGKVDNNSNNNKQQAKKNQQNDQPEKPKVEKSTKPSPRKTRSATAAATKVVKDVSKTKVETPTKKSVAKSASSTLESPEKKVTSSTTRTVARKGKAAK